MSSVSLAIATHADPCGLYLSVFSALSQLEKSDLNFEILIVADGGEATKYEQAHPNIRCIRLSGQNRTGSPQGTRDIGIRNAKYKNVLCIDSHVVVSDIQKWVEEHEGLSAGLSFPAMRGASSEHWTLYGSIFDWDKSFWNTRVLYEPKSQFPYRIVQASHSGFLCDREFYISSGGYTNLQVGYGGEETQLALKFWMLGKQNWMMPQIWHAHYQPIGRNEGAEHSENYKRNFLVAAYVFGGQEYLNKIENFYKTKLQITPDIQKERLKICDGPYKGNLDLFRNYCQREGIE